MLSLFLFPKYFLCYVYLAFMEDMQNSKQFEC